MSDDTNDTVKYTVRMPESLRDDAKNRAERGELADEVRGVFRRKAYGTDGLDQPTELEQAQAEIREVRRQIDEFRQKRDLLDSKISNKEKRANRLEERIEALEDRSSELDAKVEMLENLLHDGYPMWPAYIEDKANVESDVAGKLYDKLRARNSDLPDIAFEEPPVNGSSFWTERDN